MNVSMTPVLERLRDQLAAIETVASATLYGSYVRGEFSGNTSDINLAVVVRGAESR